MRPTARRLGALLFAAGILACTPAGATDVTLVGLFPGKAVLSIDGGAPRTFSAGAAPRDGVKLISTADDSALVEFDGKRHTLALGQHIASAKPGARASVTLSADDRGHFFTQGQVNGRSVTFLVDTGATDVALSASEARRLGIDLAKAPRMGVQTDNGTAAAWRVQLDTVRVGDVVLYQVDAVAIDAPMGPVLLGNSFLNRMEMRRDGAMLTLTRRY